MASRTASNQYLGEKPEKKRSSRSRSRSPRPQSKKQQQPAKKASYTSQGVRDHDIFNLPGSDWQLLVALTIVAAVVRLFRIYQPSSVVFDEVQYVATCS